MSGKKMSSLRQFGILEAIFPFFGGGEYFHVKYFLKFGWTKNCRYILKICVVREMRISCSFNFIEYFTHNLLVK